MTVKELCVELSLEVLAGTAGLDKPVVTGYMGDLLSWVMARAPEESAWITVMGNINSVAVAKLADVSCIILCEGAHLDEDAKNQADANAIPVLSTKTAAYPLAVAISGLLGE